MRQVLEFLKEKLTVSALPICLYFFISGTLLDATILVYPSIVFIGIDYNFNCLPTLFITKISKEVKNCQRPASCTVRDTGPNIL
jgi:hypothetical protein